MYKNSDLGSLRFSERVWQLVCTHSKIISYIYRLSVSLKAPYKLYTGIPSPGIGMQPLLGQSAAAI